MKEIAIIGAGTSGLAAAISLAESAGPGIRITLYDARREPGGRTRSYIDPTSGDEIDNGQHLLMGCYTSTMNYLRMIGSQDLVRHDHLAIAFSLAPGRTAHFSVRPELMAPVNILTALATTDLLSVMEKVAAARLGRLLQFDRLPEGFEEMTCAQFWAHLSQPASLVAKLWEPITLATMNAPGRIASARLFVDVFRMIFLQHADYSSLVTPTVGLSSLLITPAISKLESLGVEAKLGSKVDAVSLESDGFSIRSEGAGFHCDSVIIASPPGLELPLQIAPPINPEYGPILNAYLWVDRQILTAPIKAFVGTTLQWAFSKPSHFSKQRIALTVSAAAPEFVAKPNEELVDHLWAELQSRLPAAFGAELMHSQVIREKRATPLFTPEAQAARPGTTTAVPGLFLAGDLVQNGLPATIEGAIRNGFTAAKKTLEYLHQQS